MTVTNTTPPAVSGTARVGQQLQTTTGSWTFDLDFLSYAYRWLRCDAAGDNCSAITGATASVYTVQSADVGHTLKSEVTATEHADSPTPTPPSPELLWAPPTLTSPATRALTNSSRSVPSGSGDLRITAATQDLTGAIGQIIGYNDVEMIGGKIVGGETGSNGHLIPREVTGTFHIEGWNITLTTYGDAITVRYRVPILQIEACYIEVTKGSSTFHADGYQTQYQISDDLRMDRNTIVTNYQGVFLSNEAPMLGDQPAPSRLTHQTFSRILFKKNGTLPATFFFKAFPPRPGAAPIGITEMYDVWMPNESPLSKVYPNGDSWKAWDGSNNRYGVFLETKTHPVNGSTPFLRFSTSSDTVPPGKPLAGQQCGDCGVRGDGGIWLYNNLSEVPDDVGAPSDAGRSYVSPGYQ